MNARHRALVVEEILGIEHIVAQEIVSAAMEAVRAGTRDQVDDGRARESVFGTEIRLLYLEFLDSIHRGGIGGLEPQTRRLHLPRCNAIN